jgi:hypothetical protein
VAAAPARAALPRRAALVAAAAAHGRSAPTAALATTATALALFAASAPAALADVVTASTAASIFPFPEPANALSLPTWAIHVSSVAEWLVAMSLAWRYADAVNDPRWKGLTWGMLPALGSAMCACTWHFFYNAPELDGLVALQAALTVVGNCTLWLAAYRIYRGGKEREDQEKGGAV